MGIRSIKAALAEAREHYHTIAQELTPPEQAVLFAKIKDLQTMLSNAICEGANP